MKQKSVIQTVRFSYVQIEKIRWLKEKKINPSTIIRNGFDSEFKRFKKEYEKENKQKLPF